MSFDKIDNDLHCEDCKSWDCCQYCYEEVLENLNHDLYAKEGILNVSKIELKELKDNNLEKQEDLNKLVKELEIINEMED